MSDQFWTAFVANLPGAVAASTAAFVAILGASRGAKSIQTLEEIRPVVKATQAMVNGRYEILEAKLVLALEQIERLKTAICAIKPEV